MTATQKRILINKIALSFSTLSAIIALGFLFWILYILVSNGINALNWNIFTMEGAPPGYEDSGLKHALVGQAILIALATLIGVPLGILAGTYLSEYGKNSRMAHTIRDISDIMMSAPSIVIGAFVYAVVVMPMGHFSAWAGAIALGIIMIPIILRTTDDMLNLVPGTLREAAFALGAPRWKVSLMITLRAAKSGVMTGLLLAVARISGETAPLLFTALSNQFWSADMTEPMANLPVTIFKFAMSPFADWQELAWAGVFIITLGVLILNIIARVVFRPHANR